MSTETPPPIDRLLRIMAALRDPDSGCPWDLRQSFATIVPFTIEEAYEVADAVARNNLAELKDELGDLLFQVVFHAQMAAEADAFDFADVVAAIADKMERRHPHVFGGSAIGSAEAQRGAWEAHKQAERAGQGAVAGRPRSALDGVARALPALTRAEKLQQRAAREGFDWTERGPVIETVAAELEELRHEVETDGDRDRIEDEVGDLLFSCVNLARHLDIDPESALRRATAKFERRFRAIEVELAEDGRTPGDASMVELDALWTRIKRAERRAS